MPARAFAGAPPAVGAARLPSRRSTCVRRRPRACAKKPGDDSAPRPFKLERDPVGPPMRWGRIPEGEKCTYCEDEKVVDCPSCEGQGYFGRTITCRYCSGRKRLACPLCVEDDPYAWTYGSDSRTEVRDGGEGDGGERPVSE